MKSYIIYQIQFNFWYWTLKEPLIVNFEQFQSHGQYVKKFSRRVAFSSYWLETVTNLTKKKKIGLAISLREPYVLRNMFIFNILREKWFLNIWTWTWIFIFYLFLISYNLYCDGTIAIDQRYDLQLRSIFSFFKVPLF